MNSETIHRWEAAGLGQAPYTFLGARKNVIRHDDGSTQPGGTCAYCSTGIANEFMFRSADGRTFVVGSTCVHKSDAKGLTNAKKYDAAVAELRHETTEAAETAKLAQLIEQYATVLATRPHIYGYTDKQRQPLSQLDFCQKAIGGPAQGFALKWIKENIASKVRA